MALPNFLCIGATKAGTTWLHEQLDNHPEVRLPVVKELHYFSSLHSPREREWASKTVTKAMQRELRKARRDAGEGAVGKANISHLKNLLSLPIFTDRWYRYCFERPDRRGDVCGEITPSYAELQEEGIEHVCSMLPGVRIIHILRHPLDRALSHLRMAVHRRDIEATDRDLMAMIKRNPHIVSRGAYQDQLPRWRAKVPSERIMTIPFGRVRVEPLALIADVERFLGVSNFGAYPVEKRVNSTKSIVVSPEVISILEAKVQPAIEFIRREFGEEFLAATR